MLGIKAHLEAVDELAPIVVESADEADRRGRLSDELVGAMHDAGLFRMLLPQADGGGGLRLGDSFPVVEAMARLDGAAGWNLAIGSNSLGVVASSAGDALRADVLGDPRAIVASSFNPAGLRAELVEGGVAVDGRMTFASGSPHATRLAALAVVDDGPPIIAVFGRDDAQPLDTWHVAGLRATGSHDWTVRVFVPDGWWFRAASLGSPETDVMARLPLLSLLGPSLSFVALGIARHAIDLLVEVAAAPVRERADVQIAVAEAAGSVDAGRAVLTTTWFELETTLLAGGPVTTADLARLRLASVTATRLAAEATDQVQRAAGSSALYERTGIARCWRDVHAVTQHAMVSHRQLDRVGRVLLRLDPGPGPI